MNTRGFIASKMSLQSGRLLRRLLRPHSMQQPANWPGKAVLVQQSALGFKFLRISILVLIELVYSSDKRAKRQHRRRLRKKRAVLVLAWLPQPKCSASYGFNHRVTPPSSSADPA